MASAEYHKAWRARHPESVHAAHNRYKQGHREEIREKARVYDRENYERIQQWFRDHPEQRRIYNQRGHRKYRAKAVEVVARGKLACAGCGCDDPSVLEINHMNGGGYDEYRGRTTSFYRAIINGTRPLDDLNLLCKVCNALHTIRLKEPELARHYQVIWTPPGAQKAS